MSPLSEASSALLRAAPHRPTTSRRRQPTPRSSRTYPRAAVPGADRVPDAAGRHPGHRRRCERQEGRREAARKAGAKSAIEKKEAAEKAEQEAQERTEAKAAASQDTAGFPVQSSCTVAQTEAMAAQKVPSDQFQCFSNIVDHESSWNYTAVNASSGAYGLFQALSEIKTSSVGADRQTNPAAQIQWGLDYMNSTYDSPCGAWAFWQANHWY